MQNIYLHNKYEHLKIDILECITHFNTKGNYVTKGERNVIKSFKIGGETLNVKSFKTPKLINSFVYKHLRKSKAKRSFEYAIKLIDCNISTPFPVGYVENTNASGLTSSYYISKHVDYDFDFRVLIHNPLFSNRDEILRQFTQFTYKLHENNINFLDHSPGNTLIVENGSKYDFYLIDLNRMQFETMDLEKRMENLKRLWLSKKMIRIIATEYAEISEYPFEEVYNLLLQSSQDFKRRINRKKYLKRKYLKKKK
ncbi:lipopolysaccharide kinase InaA family protein [Lacinutrix sp. Bg11-31]|uniref:lipopolysaccharide kinase InaA family protein n=1 Tax=Lacinutrix sp. Bg11-31 TaxID=2057808 RepID=UPI000C30F979|nr:lipopolysaccharide kinase InaA family protein [Lacinutrix sp. Bg11-31]AUC80652.1 lipopolysaccharide kinase [Lacinutrix sp. Bg11-31]